MVRRILNSKKAQVSESIMDFFGYIFIALLLAFAIIISSSHSNQVSNKLTNTDVYYTDVDMNVLNSLKVEVDGLKISDHLRRYCIDGKDKKYITDMISDSLNETLMDDKTITLRIEEDVCDYEYYQKFTCYNGKDDKKLVYTSNVVFPLKNKQMATIEILLSGCKK